jgi:hypothetical protein
VFNPYSNDDDVLNIQGDALTVNNGTTRIVLNGTLELTKDQRGLKAALALKEAVDAVVAALQSEGNALVAKVKEEPEQKPGTVKNPFQ